MEKIKQYKFIILIVILLLGFSFYWFEWRPAQIRKECNIKALQQTDEGKGLFKNTEAITFYNFTYALCLHEKGL
jgi:hypothetical protein